MESELLQQELHVARQAQADAEFSRELAGKIVAKVAEAVQCSSFERLKLMDVYISKSLKLVGVPEDE